MNIVLVCLFNFQDYILVNIQQLIKLGHKNIYVITNSSFFHNFDEYSKQIILINYESLDEDYDFESKSGLDKNFRNGFWMVSSLRFFYIYSFMEKYKIEDVIHLENDVTIYYNCNNIIHFFEKTYIYLPFDTFTRNVASIMYIPNSNVLKTLLDNYNFDKNDMENFSIIKNNKGLIKNLPIFIKKNDMTDEEKFVCENSNIFPFIFDGAAIGQYLGGVDPQNIPGDTRGFVNETCVIKYNNYEIFFEFDEKQNKKPFIVIDGEKIPIFNLHIHSKNLSAYI